MRPKLTVPLAPCEGRQCRNSDRSHPAIRTHTFGQKQSFPDFECTSALQQLRIFQLVNLHYQERQLSTSSEYSMTLFT